jgi:HEAT repeat protein
MTRNIQAVVLNATDVRIEGGIGGNIGGGSEITETGAMGVDEAYETAKVKTEDLIAILDDQHSTVEDRHNAVLDAMNAEDPATIPSLIKHLDNKYGLVIRQNAIRALGAIGDKRAVPTLAELLEKPVIGNIADEAENEAILRRFTVEALGFIGDASVLPILQKISKSEKEYQSVRELAESAIRKIEKVK